MPLSLQREYLAATDSPRQELVLLHGWACNRGIWRPMLPALRPWANITLVDIPGLAPGLQGDGLEAVLAGILDCSPAHAVYLGWSLGGQLAIELARLAPERVAAIVTLCSNPRFFAGDNWPGMAPELLDRFRAAAASDTEATLRRFDSLQASGAQRPRPLLRQLQAMRRGQGVGDLTPGLEWLATLDQRAVCASLPADAPLP